MTVYSGKPECRSYTERLWGLVEEAFGYAFPAQGSSVRPGLFCSSQSPGNCRGALAALERGRTKQEGGWLGACANDERGAFSRSTPLTSLARP